jgi:hypothetical protein
VFSKSGIVGKPISFIGYKVTPGDKVPINTLKTDPYADILSENMPTYDGGNRAKGIGFNIENQEYITLKNFQIKNYAIGMMCGAPGRAKGNLNVNNVEVMNCGDVNSSYSGLGITLGSMSTKFSNSNIFTNCLVVNAAAEGISINGDSNTFTNCKVYCNDVTTSYASTDYYIIVCGNFNNLSNCTADRLQGLSHAGHGIGAKSNAEQVIDKGLSNIYPAINPQYNKFTNCEAHNMGESFYVRHRGSRFNTFKNCTATGTHTGLAGSPGGEGVGMVSRDGASDNTFTGCAAKNCASGIEFEDTVEDGDTGINPPGHPGNNNLFTNCLIYNCYIGVNYSDYSIVSDAGYNTISNCTFYKTRYINFCTAARPSTQMHYTNNIYYGCLPNMTGGYLFASKYGPTINARAFKNCCFFNIQGGLAEPKELLTYGGGNIEADPLFVDPDNMDFHLKPESPCNQVGMR